ncbi:MAG TPA: short-chain dehydrogenase, partial [Noviherbaspirillum sp.]
MSNKIALVFGGSRGIGAACVHALAESGYDVAYTYVSSAPNLPAQIGSGRTKGYAVN